MYTGFLNSLTSTAKIADCPGVCVHALATLMCDDVLEDVQCPTTSMRCCLQDPINSTSSSENVIDEESSTMSTTITKTTTISTTPVTTTTALSTSTSFTSAKTTSVRSADLVLENISWVKNCSRKLLLESKRCARARARVCVCVCVCVCGFYTYIQCVPKVPEWN